VTAARIWDIVATDNCLNEILRRVNGVRRQDMTQNERVRKQLQIRNIGLTILWNVRLTTVQEFSDTERGECSVLARKQHLFGRYVNCREWNGSKVLGIISKDLFSVSSNVQYWMEDFRVSRMPSSCIQPSDLNKITANWLASSSRS
jgi:hypothetical protein